jgi:Tol biopolymer transport system component
MSLRAGEKLGPYEILAQIGAGGMGEVWKARDTRLDRIVAIKTSKAQFSERFEREARAVAALNHPHICTLHDVGPNYLVMEFVEGTPLKGPVPPAEAVRYASQIAEALDAAHRKGTTHRDLKPGNILITRQGIKLLDFGLARIAPSEHDPTLTIAGQVMGTPAYMSPEQWEGKAGDARSDIYAFGCVLYEMLTGKRVTPDRAPLEQQPLEGIVAKCLEKDPESRWQSARDIKAVLELPAPRVPPPRRLWPWIAAAAVLAGIGIALGMVLWRSAAPVIERPVVRLDLDLGPDVSFGSTTGPAVILSPDGTRLVFNSQDGDGTRHLFARRLDQSKALRLPGTEGASAPFFSPDGQWVGFFGLGKLKKVRIDGGETRALCDAPSGRGATWSEDGTIIAALGTQVGLTQIPAEGGEPVPITTLNVEAGENTHRWPQVLPGGKAVLFNASLASGNYEEAEIAVVSLTDHRRTTVLQHAGMYPRYLPSGHLVFVTRGNLFAVPFDLQRLEVRGAPTVLEPVASNPALGSAHLDFSRSGTLAFRTGGTEGLRTIQWLDGAGKTAPFGTEPGSYQYVHFSPDGSHLAYLMSEGSSIDLWIYDWQRGSKTRLASGLQGTLLAWSPDGQFLVFRLAGGMFWTRADGAGKPQPLTQSKYTQFPTSFSPDGGRLVYSEMIPGAGAEIRTVPVESKSGQMRAGQPEVFLKTADALGVPTFSPDGRWLAYADAPAGIFEVYVRAFPDKGAQVQISNAGGTMPVWSKDGHQLFYRTEDQRMMVADYTVKGDSFVVRDKPRMWFDKRLANIGLGLNFDLSPDGKRFVVLMPADSPEPRETQSHVTLVVNYFDEIRRRVAQAK